METWLPLASKSLLSTKCCFYRYCNCAYYTNLAVQYSSLNYAAIAEQVMRPSVAMILEFGPIVTKMNAAKANGDYYTTGLYFSKLWQYFFDGTMPN